MDERTKALETWAERIADRWIEKNEYVLDSVLATAAIKVLSRVSRRNRKLLPKNIVVKLVQVELNDLKDTTARA